ncbi:hypothetical protein [Clostridium manihotivorum]|uniref:Lipoprotein n=1 Tax=Clostridium manihotivorum TaxID=2320868 RepID=A0A3R5QVH5_9CLOT|nr:hypothetical protein [Clostridium manihotivorum]QAA30481.1 hypothetical protein C1I91_01695 [Clostridium manihotivorum]
MKKQFILVTLCVAMVLSLSGCSKSVKHEAKSEAKTTVETKKDDSNSKTSTNSASSDSSTSTSSSSSSSTASNGGITVINEGEDAELKYEKGKYKEIDEAFSIAKDYYLNGINAVSSKVVSNEYDDSKDDADKWSAVPLTDKEKKNLDLNYQSFKNQVPDKVQEISLDSYSWEKVAGGNPKYIVDITLRLVIKTDKGDSYSTSCYVTAINKNGDIKINIK